MRKTVLVLAAVPALALSGALWAALAQEQAANPFAADSSAAPAGMAIYNATCASCHGPAGIGGSGPALNTQQSDGDAALFHIIQNGVDGTAMPSFASLSDENIWRLVTYIRSLTVQPAPPAPVANAKAGEALFFGQGGCTACHEVNGSGLDLASDLSAEGLKPVATIRDALGHAAAHPRFVTVTMADGTKLTGLVQAEDIFTLHLKQRDGKLGLLAKAKVKNIADAANPLAGLRLSDKDKDDIAAYLAGHTARNLADTAKLVPAAILPWPRLAAPELRNWVTARGSMDGSNFSALNGIVAAKAAQIQARWSASLGDGASAATPIAVDGMLYVSGAAGGVTAFDARGGLPVWRFARQPLLANRVQAGGNRGVAMLDGRIFVGTSDNKLIALDAHNGRELWEKQAASTLDGYAMTGAPLALRTRIVVGVAGAGAKARGWLDAYDPAAGTRLWRFDSVAAANAAGAMTDSVGAYEAANVTLYWSTARASDDGAAGDSLLALNGNSGAVTWRHKLKPGAGGDSVVLTDLNKRALLLHLGRDGLLTVLDRATGKPVLQKALLDGGTGKASISFDRSSAIAYLGLGDAVAATDTRTGRLLWRATVPGGVTGVLATRGGLVFAGTAQGEFVALDAKSGKLAWNFHAAGPITASPVSYAVDGKPQIAIVAGNMLYAFALPN